MDHATSSTRLAVAAVAMVIALGGCQLFETRVADEVQLSGSIYTDFRVDSPCAQQQPPAERGGGPWGTRDLRGVGRAPPAGGRLFGRFHPERAAASGNPPLFRGS